jgi:uncharacterized membrane protein
MMYVNPFLTYQESPESVQVLIGVIILVLGVVGLMFLISEIAYKWWHGRRKK